jgi:hypothetical protein
MRCKYAADADAFMRKLMQSGREQPVESETDDIKEEALGEVGDTADQMSTENSETVFSRPPRSSRSRRPSMTARKSGRSLNRVATEYDGNPFDIDHVNTQKSRVSTTPSKP